MSQWRGCKTSACFLALNLCRCQNPSRDSRFGTKRLVLGRFIYVNGCVWDDPLNVAVFSGFRRRDGRRLMSMSKAPVEPSLDRLMTGCERNSAIITRPFLLHTIESRTCEQTEAVPDGDSASRLVLARVSWAEFVCTLHISSASNGSSTTTVTPTQSVPQMTCVSKECGTGAVL